MVTSVALGTQQSQPTSLSQTKKATSLKEAAYFIPLKKTVCLLHHEHIVTYGSVELHVFDFVFGKEGAAL